jgi:ATP diphosphatase
MPDAPEGAAGASGALDALQEVVDRLMAPDGCPWDREQTPESLADYLIEESHELASAIRAGNAAEACRELGDIAFLMLMVAKLYGDSGKFTLADALASSRAKMIRRHPHVFGDAVITTSEEHLRSWEKIKRAEHAQASEAGEQGGPRGVFDSLPMALPALIKAYRIHSKAARVGFTWADDEDAEQQAEEEWLEWLDACRQEDPEAQRRELGDMLFTLVEVGRRKGIKANDALDLAAMRFLRRFAAMEKAARLKGLEFSDMDPAAQNDLWDEVKAGEKALPGNGGEGGGKPASAAGDGS